MKSVRAWRTRGAKRDFIVEELRKLEEAVLLPVEETLLWPKANCSLLRAVLSLRDRAEVSAM